MTEPTPIVVKPGIVFVNGSTIHIAIARLTALCGASNPLLDDPHLCAQCRVML